MENMEDKAISEKLSGLDTLPPGYEPNLDSKWNLLRTAMCKSKTSSKRFVYVWMSMTASLLILCLLGIGLYFNQDKKIIVQKKVMPIIPLPCTKQSLNYFSEKNSKKNAVKIQMAVVSHVNTISIDVVKVADQSLFKPENTALSQKDSAMEDTESETIKIPMSVQLMPAKKKRYIQVDFGEVSIQSAIPQEQLAFSLSFRRKVLKDEEENGIDDNHATDKSLVLFKLNISR